MTSKPALAGELGLMTLYGRRCYKKLVFWFHVITLPDSRLIRHIYSVSKEEAKYKANWYRRIGSIFNDYGMMHIQLILI